MSNLVTLPKNGSLTKKDNMSNFPSLSSWFNDFGFNEFPSLFSTNFNTGITLPKVNIKDEADAFIVEMAVPGLKKQDFNINLDNNTLAISTELKDENETEKDNYTRREFGYSSFKRSFVLPDSVDNDNIKANYNDGILTVTLPKREEAKQKPARNIKIS
ncbi:heat-shock protein [Tamlana sedimentorum]|uniref:Heat-shock protein n=1 Tax=Neotamlana sedimentorum TaxID=1435349 RepID=A0A0D7WBJ7_9FLAO|nr:Hsp20/alpha crystallin family protein [Tamlana sedimentorum]KJD35122.1 heat-shock protein [Tamlana sedimentorum]